ncbi:Spore germination protein B3 [Neobacillus rhizosphaerae]|uniref:Spore germination protein B3 n=1 Tax=Neobacillus rhizosphaerae TaxID=2880965 RepID=A0ABM9ER07_9BACI|nr:Ger(x)C family spore germination protein [Neobacillus rhizosphaerae]CAH2715047.1 Spore germination protein B3 [Neobacillus rhizosphaerae]
MKRIIVILSISFLILLTGCWNRKELNELAIVVGLGIDKSDDQFIVTVQVVNPGEIAAKQGTSGKAPVVVYQDKGDTLFEAIRRITTISPRKLYFSHLRFLVYGEELAREGIGETLDALTRDQEFRTDFYITVAKEAKGGEILRVLTALEKIPVNQLYDSLEASQKSWSPTITITLDQLITELVSPGIDAKLTGITLKGEEQTGEVIENVQRTEPYTRLKYKDIGVFKGDKLIGWLNEEESKGLNEALGNVKSTILEVPCTKKGKTAIELIRTKSDIKTVVTKDGPKGIIKYKAEANVGNVQCKTLDLMKPETISDLETKAENNIKKMIRETLKVTQENFETDLFGFGEALHRSNPDYWKQAKSNWNQQYKELPVELKVDVRIKRIGTIKNSPLNKISKQ